MAGRPATVRSGQSTLLYWVIIFAILWMVFLGLFIFILVNKKAADNRAQRAEADLKRMGQPQQYYRDEATARGTNIFGAMTEDMKEVATLVTGTPADVAVNIRAKSDEVLEGIAARKDAINATDTLLTALVRLDEAHTMARDEAERSAKSIDQLQQDKDALTEQLKSKEDEFEAEVANLSDQLKQVQAEKVRSLQEKDDQLQALQNTLNVCETRVVKLEREGNTVIRDKDIEIGRLSRQIGLLQEQIQSLKPSTFDPDAILTKADGRVLRAVPGSDVVYINLGAADEIKVGMGFEVYSQDYRGSQNLRGKASLEIANVMEETAECRVMRRSAGQPLIEGDIVVNIAYERSRRPQFVVRGDFDLDYDGQIDLDGAAVIASLIRRWGGDVVDELSPAVDFVVIGMRPRVPEFGDATVATDIVRDQAQRRALLESQFGALVDQANKMYIPVITQSQFLYLVGDVRDMRLSQR